MSIKSIQSNHDHLERNVDKLIQYGIQIATDASSVSGVRKTSEEKAMLLEGLLLRSCALWERFVEKEIVYVIELDSSKFKENMGLPPNTKLSLKLIRALLYSDRYQDYHDIERYKSYFRRILSDKRNPFENISKEKRERIDLVYKMRNYLSHYSDYSRRKLFEVYKRYCHLGSFIEPGRYLLTYRARQFEKLLHNFILVSARMRRTYKGG